MADAGVQASIHKNKKTTLPRIYNFISSDRFKDSNLKGRLYPESKAVDLSHWALPGGEGAWQDWSFQQIINQAFTPATIGQSFGPTWTTHWFKVVYNVPVEWVGKEIHLRWSSDSEATVWSSDGKVLQGLSTGTTDQMRPDYILTRNYPGGAGPTTMYIEMAASKMFGATDSDQIDPPNPNKYFQLTRCEIAVMDTLVYKLTRDLDVLYQLANNMSTDPRGYQALYTANQMVNNIIKGQDSAASDLANAHFAKANGQRAHTLAAIGNCHIDSAWLWPYSETKRKVARSFSSQLKLMEDYPELIFVASQAQQWAWCKQYYPELFERIKVQVARGSFLPVGATWTEMDGNIPSGESFIRQFLHGQRFYQQELGITCKEFWLPDTFGYSSQIPGLMRHMNLTRFLTQKMSWSLVNKFPHHNFTWEGLDGSTVLAHFPPGDSYHMKFDVEEMLRTVSNLEDKGRAGTSAFLFGYGDGGGGPTQDMLEKARRLKNTDGCPKVDMMTPDAMFLRLEGDQHNMVRWVGELYLELHNGTYTSQAAMKRLCRQSEFILRDSELMLSAAVAILGATANQLLTSSLAELDAAWKKVLLNQFHDVLPGSSIGIVYPQAVALYNEAQTSAQDVLQASVEALFGTGTPKTWVAMNTLQWAREEVVVVPLARTAGQKLHESSSSSSSVKTQSAAAAGGDYAFVKVPAMGYATLEPATPTNIVTLASTPDGFVLDNGKFHAEVNSLGQVTSLVVAGDDRDLFKRQDGTQLVGNQMVLFDDQPLYWDAWDVMDYHLETPTVINAVGSGFDVTPVTVVESGPLVVRLRWGAAISANSSFTQDIELTADATQLTFSTSVSWHESRKFLKVGFETNVKTNNASYDVQFGHLSRPTHMNTSWDSARYEVCGHKWADLSEPDWGLAVLSDSKYGWMARGHTITLSLLRSPKAPDDKCDMGDHSFRYSLMPHTGTLQEAKVVRRAYEFNNPLRLVQLPTATTAGQPSWSVATLVGEGVVLHTVKPAEDGSGRVLLRLYESNGSKTKTTLKISLPVTAVNLCNGMEVLGASVPFTQDSGVTSIPLRVSPFSITALMLTF